MPCIVTDGSRYLTRDENGRAGISTSKSKAMLFDSHGKAQNYIDNLPKMFRLGCNWETQEEECVCDQISIDVDFCVDEEFADIIENIKVLYSSIECAKQRESQIRAELEAVSKELSDVEHAAELFELDKEEGFKLYEQLRDVRIRRRRLKNEVLLLQMISETGLYEDLKKRVIPNLMSLGTRRYKPRVMKDIFEREVGDKVVKKS